MARLVNKYKWFTCLVAATLSTVGFSQPCKVEIVKNQQEFQLLKDGKDVFTESTSLIFHLPPNVSAATVLIIKIL